MNADTLRCIIQGGSGGLFVRYIAPMILPIAR
jgi:hypothetical protein